MRRFRVLHVSDLHASKDRASEQEEIVEALVADVADLRREGEYDALVFTGDLGKRGHLDEFELGQSLLLEPVKNAAELRSDQTVLLPGNHDVDRGRVSRPTELGLRAMLAPGDSTSARRELAELFAGPRSELDVNRLTDWEAFFNKFYSGSAPSPELIDPFTRVFTLEGTSVSTAVIALNTAWRSSSDEDRNRLVVGVDQLDAALRYTADRDLRIVAMHHPLDWLVDWDATDLRRVIERHHVLVLSGHEHVPNPTAEFTTRGNAVYARAGCLYEHPTYLNGYSVIDVDLDEGSVTISLRTWFGGEHDRHEFGPAENLVKGGLVVLALPRQSVTPARAVPDFTDVMHALTDVLDERGLAVHAENAPINPVERLVPPRYWPLPYNEVTALRLEGHEPHQAEPLASLGSSAQLIAVCGETEAGVTSALVWLLAQEYTRSALRQPAYLGDLRRIDKDEIAKAVRRELARAGMAVDRQEPLPPMIVALDDVAIGDAKSLQRLAQFAVGHPDWLFLLGSHDHRQASLERPFIEAGVAIDTCYLGPLGRRELRQLVTTTVGTAPGDLVDNVLNVIINQKLPRTALTMTALALVLSEEPDAAVINQSALLDAYVGLFLGSNEAIDYHQVGIDYRGRVHLLGWFAARLDELGTFGLPRTDAERELGDYLRQRCLVALSPGTILTDLIDRSVLRELDGYVDFRTMALFHLFQAKWMQEDEGARFLAEVMNSPLDHRDAVEHFAGLKRDAKSLLERVGHVLGEATTGIDSSLTVNLFDNIKDRPGWSEELPGVERLREIAPPPLAPTDDATLDERFESLATSLEKRAATNDVDEGPEMLREVETLGQATVLASRVLRNSELVPDVELRKEVLINSLRGWSLLAIAVAIHEDLTAELATRIRAALDEVADEAPATSSAEETDPTTSSRFHDSIERFIETMVVFLHSIGATTELGSPHMAGIMSAALDDERIAGHAGPALIGTLCFCMLEFDGWASRLESLYESHGAHPIVARLAEAMALTGYHSRATRQSDVHRLERLLVSMYLKRDVPSSATGKVKTAMREKVLGELRASRSRHASETAIFDPLDEEEDAS